jgi:hyperosmotically inducible periplasmic protein
MKAEGYIGRNLTFLGISVLACNLMIPAFAVTQDQSGTTAPDNSATNKTGGPTADKQSQATSDRMLTQNIRKAIIADKSISMYGHNVKIIASGGAVTLKGPVHTEEEKQNIGAKAADAAGGASKVTNDLTVKQ